MVLDYNEANEVIGVEMSNLYMRSSEVDLSDVQFESK